LAEAKATVEELVGMIERGYGPRLDLILDDPRLTHKLEESTPVVIVFFIT
jgi:hypothetical protein